MVINNWMSWEGGVDLIAKTNPALEMPNVIVHVARMVHTPVGSAPGGMLFWQPDVTAPPLVFGFVSSDEAVADYFGKHIFAGTPFEKAPSVIGKITITTGTNQASALVEIPGFNFATLLSDFSKQAMIQREPTATSPFYQQGLEAAAAEASLKVNGEAIEISIPPIGITGGPCAVLAACGVYGR